MAHTQNSNASKVDNQAVWPGFAVAMTTCTQVIRDIPGTRTNLDWGVLALLHERKEVTFNTVYTHFNKQIHSNYTYYSALERLTTKGFAQLSYGPKGWRRWTITPAGRDMIATLDAAAQKYLHKKTGI